MSGFGQCVKPKLGLTQHSIGVKNPFSGSLHIHLVLVSHSLSYCDLQNMLLRFPFSFLPSHALSPPVIL